MMGRLSLSSVFLVLLLSSCYLEMACTAIFASFSVTIQDSNNQPVMLDSLSIRNLDTGQNYPVCTSLDDPGPCLGRENIPTEGSYEVMNDNFYAGLSRSGSTIRIEGSKDGLSFSEDYVFRSDGCHMIYVSGPELIQLGTARQKIALASPEVPSLAYRLEVKSNARSVPGGL